MLLRSKNLPEHQTDNSEGSGLVKSKVILINNFLGKIKSFIIRMSRYPKTGIRKFFINRLRKVGYSSF
jgi:hypothetical protein